MKKIIIVFTCLITLSPLLASKTKAINLSGVQWSNILQYGSASMIRYGKNSSNTEKSIRFDRPSLNAYENKNLISQQKNLKKRMGITASRQERTSLEKYRLVPERPIRRSSQRKLGSSYKEKTRLSGKKDFTDLESMSKSYWNRKTNSFDRDRYDFLKTTTRP